MTILSAAVTLLLVMDPIGNVPVFLSVLRDVDPDRRRLVIFREAVIALAVLVAFLFFGPALLGLMQLEESALRIAGGVVLFLIALRMIFPHAGGIFGTVEEGGDDPLVVPLAIPLLAGPSAVATVMLLATQAPERIMAWLGAILLAWAIGLAILLQANPLAKLLGRRGLMAVERLMGLLLAVIAVQMFMTGVEHFLTDAISGGGEG